MHYYKRTRILLWSLIYKYSECRRWDFMCKSVLRIAKCYFYGYEKLRDIFVCVFLRVECSDLITNRFHNRYCIFLDRRKLICYCFNKWWITRCHLIRRPVKCSSRPCLSNRGSNHLDCYNQRLSGDGRNELRLTSRLGNERLDLLVILMFAKQDPPADHSQKSINSCLREWCLNSRLYAGLLACCQFINKT